MASIPYYPSSPSLTTGLVSTKLRPRHGNGGRRKRKHKGRYTVQPKKTTEAGTRKKVQSKADQSGYFTSRNFWRPGYRNVLHEPSVKLAGLVLPSGGRSSWGPDDPRHRSRNLGPLLDYPLGWAADVLSLVPVVGPFAGSTGRALCRIVRGLEDGINFGTKWSGLTLFILLCLLFPTAMGASCVVDRTEADNSTRNGTLTSRSIFRRVSNCCDASQIFHCTDHWCTHQPGCVPCGLENGNATCWIPYSRLVSHHPEHVGVDMGLGRHVEYLALASTLCELLEIGELCAAASMVGTYVYANMEVRGNWTCDADCFLLVSSGYDPGFMAFLHWVGSQLNWFTVILDLASRIPAAIWHTSGQAATIISAVTAVNLLSGKYVKAIAFLAFYVEAVTSTSLPRSTEHHSCSAIKPPMHCNNTMPWDESKNFLLYCFDPHFVSVTRYANGFVGIPWRVRGCVWLETNRNQTVTRCCARRVWPCPHCSSDCSWNVTDPKQTYELCGWGPWFTTVWYGGGPLRAAILDYPGRRYHFPDTYHWATANVVWGNQRLTYAYNKTLLDGLPPERWGRLPGVPNLARSRWTEVPRGLYSDLPDLTTGLISKDKDYPDYQLFLTADSMSIVVAAEAWVLSVLLGALMGGKFVPILVACFAVFQQAAAAAMTRFVDCVIVSTAYDVPWWLIVLLFMLAHRWRRGMYPLLLGNPILLCFVVLVHRVCPVEARSAVGFDDLGYIFAVGGCVLFCGLVLWLRYSVNDFHARLVALQGYLNFRAFHWLYNLEGYNMERLLLLTVLLPGAASTVVIFGLCACVVFNLTVDYLTSPRGRSTYQSWFRLTKNLGRATPYVQRALLRIAGSHGHYFYQHLQQTYHLAAETVSTLVSMDPAYPHTTNRRVVYARGQALACGDVVDGLPVVARLNDFVLLGVGDLPVGWSMLNPFSVHRVYSRRELTCAVVSLTGVDQNSHQGNLFKLGSMLRQWMGFGFEGRLWTCHHGPRGRRLASHRGPVVPHTDSAEIDMASYPLPKGARCFEPCYCSNVASGYLIARDLNVYEFVKGEGEMWTPISHFPLNIAKGTSGSPLLCKQGHVVGMFIAAQTCRGAITRVRIRQIASSAVVSRDVEVSDPTSNPPLVPKDDYRVEMLVAPTGSGKSTKLPMTYYNAGHRVLVLNPSVATTLSMLPYIKSLFGIRPNIYAGTHTTKTGSRLTYSTYGRFLASPLPMGHYDVIICDECHAIDATSVLGIGRVLDTQQSLKTRLVILATATPPGCPVKPHPNIQEIALDDQGEVPFHGCKLPVAALRTGRHLVFQCSKRHCEAMVEDLTSRGIKAVAYYRGLPTTVIPLTGDVVVVATDALMTGYTGNFDSVFDCNLMVTPTFEVDMDPTFTLGIRTMPQDSINRMQRRGRTGRGRPGQYYYVSKEAVVSGLVPEANIIECFDSGIAYYGLTPAEIAAALSIYRDEAGLGTFKMNLNFCIELFGHINPTHGDVSIAKDCADNYVLLTAYQRGICRVNKGQKPSDSPRWRGLKPGDGWYNIYNLDGKSPGGAPSHPDIDVIALLLADVENDCSLVNTLIGLGAGFAASWIALDAFGATFIREVCSVTVGETQAERAQVMEDFIGDLIETEECSFGVLPELYASLRSRIQGIGEAAVKWFAQNPDVPAAVFVRAHAASLLSLLQYSAGLLTLDSNPICASAMAFFSGILCPLPLPTKLFLAVLGGAFASKIGNERSAILFVGASAIGALADTSGMSGVLTSLLTGYAAASSTASVVFQLLCKKLPSALDLAGLATVVTNPGGALLGAIVAGLTFSLTTQGADVWPNRLLAMLTRGNALPDNYFLETRDLRESLCNLFKNSTPLSLLTRVVGWLNQPVIAQCDGGVRGFLIDLWHNICRLAAVAREMVVGATQRVWTPPGVPLYSCTKPYKGRWQGTGQVKVICGCGRQGIWSIQLGRAEPVSISKLCRAYWGGVPINNTLVGTARPYLTDWKTMTVPIGYDSYVQYLKKGEDIFVVATSGDITVPSASPYVAAAVAVDGVCVSPWAGDYATPWTQEVTYNGVKTSLPFQIVGLEEPASGSVAPKFTLRWAWQACGFPKQFVEQHPDWISFMRAWNDDPDSNGGRRVRDPNHCFYCFCPLEGEVRTQFGHGNSLYCSLFCSRLAKKEEREVPTFAGVQQDSDSEGSVFASPCANVDITADEIVERSTYQLALDSVDRAVQLAPDLPKAVDPTAFGGAILASLGVKTPPKGVSLPPQSSYPVVGFPGITPMGPASGASEPTFFEVKAPGVVKRLDDPPAGNILTKPSLVQQAAALVFRQPGSKILPQFPLDDTVDVPPTTVRSDDGEEKSSSESPSCSSLCSPASSFRSTRLRRRKREKRGVDNKGFELPVSTQPTRRQQLMSTSQGPTRPVVAAESAQSATGSVGERAGKSGEHPPPDSSATPSSPTRIETVPPSSAPSGARRLAPTYPDVDYTTGGWLLPLDYTDEACAEVFKPTAASEPCGAVSPCPEQRVDVASDSKAIRPSSLPLSGFGGARPKVKGDLVFSVPPGSKPCDERITLNTLTPLDYQQEALAVFAGTQTSQWSHATTSSEPVDKLTTEGDHHSTASTGKQVSFQEICAEPSGRLLIGRNTNVTLGLENTWDPFDALADSLGLDFKPPPPMVKDDPTMDIPSPQGLWVKADQVESILQQITIAPPAQPLSAITVEAGERLCEQEADASSEDSWVTTSSSHVSTHQDKPTLGTIKEDPPTDPEMPALEGEEAKCASWSYSWLNVSAAAKAFAHRVLDPVASVANNLVRKRGLIYATEPADITSRAAKVTVIRQATYGHHHSKWLNRAIKLAAQLNVEEMTWDEAASVTSNKTARSRVTGLTGREVKAGHPTAVQEVSRIVNALRDGDIPEPYDQVTIMPKSEVFVRRRAKYSTKPPRIIAYPHLEMRFAEKLILGKLAPAVAKAVCGEEYGFQYNPQQRVDRLVKMWRQKKTPAVFTSDIVCFDSTITPADVDHERLIYRSATKKDETKAAIDALHRRLYAGGPMISQQGEHLGRRNCRASGVFTTSSSNTITAWLKVHAACDMAGIKSPSLLVCGDDVVCVFESTQDDASKMVLFAKAMASMGAPLGATPKALYDLELAEACSSNVTTIRYNDKVDYILTRDPAIPFARCTAEGKGFNPEGAWIGNLVGYSRTLWSRVIAVQLMETLINLEEIPKMVEMDWYGKKWNLPIADLPEIMQSLHGPNTWSKGYYTNREIQRVGAVLMELGMPKYRWYRLQARKLRSLAIRRGGVLKKLATYLLGFAAAVPVQPLDDKVVARYSDVNFHDHYDDKTIDAGDVEIRSSPKYWIPLISILLISLIVLKFH
ncbi:polyprotein [Guereza hepacivirus]|uniref:Genome polyprotein n=11 Tax=Guereza hepacivirus TaxID=1354498 RepID=S5DS99_9FLAV|nr:polyprotein [Guereza hepacivirus]AGQ22077.1 polyprotein [Guereza hepacivirus]